MTTIYDPHDFMEGTHWRSLTAEERKGKKWKGRTLCDIFIPVTWPVRVERDYKLMQNGREWGRITSKGTIIRAGYAWNFCSCSPDWEKPASLPHDLIYQFSGCPWFPSWLTRAVADDLFAELCVTKSWFLYRAGLWLGSWTCWGKPPKDGEWVHVVSPAF